MGSESKNQKQEKSERSVNEAAVERLADIIEGSKKIVFFGGAGVSTESGVPDFRSEATRERAQREFGYQPEELPSADFFYAHPEIFYKYLRAVLTVPGVEPNAAHKALAQWEKEGKVLGVVTQNIDGLHQSAGSEEVWELHGSLATYHCVDCAKQYVQEDVMSELNEGSSVPVCECGSILKPDVVLYGEALPESDFTAAMNAIAEADTLIVGGTSLVVYPAAGLVRLFNGKNLVVVNLDRTGADSMADLVIHEPIGALFEAVQENLEQR